MPVKTTAKTTKKKSSTGQARPSLPPGVKRSTRPISPALRKMLMEDRAIASGGSSRAGSSSGRRVVVAPKS